MAGFEQSSKDWEPKLMRLDGGGAMGVGQDCRGQGREPEPDWW